LTGVGGLILLDTSVLVHLLRNDVVGQRMDAEQELRSRTERPLISIVTHGELLAFAKKRKWGARRVSDLESLITELVIVDIRSRPVLSAYAEVDAYCEGNGKTLSKNDLWIAATAIATSATLITNDKDFDPLQDGGLLSRIYYDPDVKT
jgi:tRNA(fMet)-specific endonuclease VapC